MTAPTDSGPDAGQSAPEAAVPRSRAMGRRGFVAAALAGGTVVGVAAATQIPRLRGVEGVAVGAPTGVTVLTGKGIDASGSRDTTDALQALIDDAPEGAQLWLPGGLYLVDGIVLRTGQSLTGPSGRAYTGSASRGARLRARAPGSTGPVLTVGEMGQVADIAVEGNGRTQPAIQPAGIGVVLERVTMLEGSVGYDANYVSGSLLSGCQIHENGVGVMNIVDSIVQTSVINANRGDGIALGAGANDNAFLGNKIEWNDGYGIQAYQALHNVVIGGIVDRNGKAGARLVECAHSTVVGVVLRRNGRLAEQTPEDDCHLFQGNCTGLVVTGISTNSGRDDDDTSGYASPSVAVRTEGGTDVTFTGNDLTGQTSGVAILSGAAGTRRTQLLNAGVTGVQSASGMRVRVGLAELAPTGGADESAEFAIDAPGDGAGTMYRLLLASLDRDGARGVAEAILLVSRDGSSAEVALSDVGNRIGAEFGPSGPFRVAARISADGRTLTVTVANTGPGAAQVQLELI